MIAPVVFPSSRIGIPIGGRYGGRFGFGSSGGNGGAEFITVEANTAEDPERVPPPHIKRKYALAYLADQDAGAAALSFGGTPMTLTPACRAMSIAKITSWYFTVGSPLMKISLSGRGS